MWSIYVGCRRRAQPHQSVCETIEEGAADAKEEVRRFDSVVGVMYTARSPPIVRD